ncbi:PepSY-associated TM helix domain-containing protein [Ottowia testudinis]|uniref:PepSY domain-containing protein n=1 Tax=Ottowia testudinis TaxID=2816950 RepID=A0A975H2M1_9BURK|nr:PepSY-associated TM helix domain-containing protein [Ottowia testudinis]QTD44341.1 PepSY domain-containing protein [Ottowia testudinis]
MRAETIRIYKSVHTWTGILTGLALFIAFYAGALTVFKDALSQWSSPPSAEEAVPLDRWQPLVVRALQTQPEAAKELRLHLSAAAHLPAGPTWSVREAGADDHDTLSQRHYVARQDDAGGLRADVAAHSSLGEFIDTLHRVVGLPGDTDPNRWFMGMVAALYTLALVSGLIVLLPSLVKDLFALRVGKNLKRMWLDAHNVVGLFSLPFHLVMALTATVFAFHDGIYYVQDRLLHEGRLNRAFAAGQPPATGARDPSTLLPPTELVARVRVLSQGFEPTMLQYLRITGPRPLVRIWGNDAAHLSPRFMGGFAALDPYTGKVLSTDFMPGRQDGPNTVVASFFALHFGTYGGTPVRWMYFFLGLAGAWLFYSGNLLWMETRRRKAQRDSAESPPQRSDVRVMAALTVGVALGCMAGISLTIAASKWLHAAVERPLDWYFGVYYSVFLGSIAWALWRGAARAAPQLLWLTTACTLAIPATSLAACVLPALGLWAHLDLASLGVDATALVGGLGVAWMARASAQRARSTPSDSVWHQKQKISFQGNSG